jgi:2-polyprenyl-3-methyl-5-hydroxy-6-metoxy-1,4-benzoquinol methylase
MKLKQPHKQIVEKELGIPPDYQFKALNSRLSFQANWHNNKLVSISELIKPGMRVLDLGTGSGNLELEFSQLAKEIVGVDYNSEALGFLKGMLAKQQIKNVKLFLSDIRNLNRSKVLGKFDLIIAIDVIEHVDLSDARKVVKSLKKYLKPNGKICIITPNYKSTWSALEGVMDKFKLGPAMHNEQHLSKFNKENLMSLFAEQGMRTISITSFNLVSWLCINKKLAAEVCKLEMKSKIDYGNLLWGEFGFK